MFKIFKNLKTEPFIYITPPPPSIKEYKSFYRMLEFSEEFHKIKQIGEEIDQLESLKKSIDRHIESIRDK